MSYTYSCKIQKRHTDFDPQGVLNSAITLSYLETVHLHYFVDVLDLKWKFSAVPLYARRFEKLEYNACITADMDVYVHFNLLSIGAASIRLELFITDGPHGKVHTEAILKLVHVNLTTQKPVPFSEEIRTTLQKQVKQQTYAGM